MGGMGGMGGGLGVSGSVISVTAGGRNALISNGSRNAGQSGRSGPRNGSGAGGSIKMGTGSWNEDEREAFVEGLHLYGRNWKMVASLVRTRTLPQIRSYAQKFLLKWKWVDSRWEANDGSGGSGVGADAEGGHVELPPGVFSSTSSAMADPGSQTLTPAELTLEGVQASVIEADTCAFAGGSFVAYIVEVEQVVASPVGGADRAAAGFGGSGGGGDGHAGAAAAGSERPASAAVSQPAAGARASGGVHESTAASSAAASSAAASSAAASSAAASSAAAEAGAKLQPSSHGSGANAGAGAAFGQRTTLRWRVKKR
jgi:SHAQKYF class myb-like DNA-binding protein